MVRLALPLLYCATFLFGTESIAQQASGRKELPIHFTAGDSRKGTGTTNPVLAQATYNYTLSPSAQLLDSLRLFYSNGRGSEFDFDNLYYDFDHAADNPNDRLLVSSSVDFDSLRRYNPPRSSRKVLRSLKDSSELVYFYYDPATARLASTITLRFNGTGYDTSTRHTYTYGIYGSVMRDSTFSRVGGTWKPAQVMVATNNTMAYPVQRTENQVSGATLIPLTRTSYTYNAANQPTSIIRQENVGGSSLRNASKDSFEFAANKMLTAYYSYTWDTTTATWRLRDAEYRHLDAVFSQPDSIWTRTFNNSSYDTTIQKLAYNDAGDPVYLRSYDAAGRTLVGETRWYYRLTINGTGVGVPLLAAKSPVVYPNPAGEVLHVSGYAPGAGYRILNTAGQVVQSGLLNAAYAIPVGGLPVGAYYLQVHGAGAAGSTVFVRR